MINIMVDLETLSSRPDAAILSIGAVVFGDGIATESEKTLWTHASSDRHFHTCIDAASAQKAGGHICPENVEWLLKHASKRWKSRLSRKGMTVHAALHAFNEWILQRKDNKGGDPDQVLIWSSGGPLNITALWQAMERSGIDPAWGRYQHRCYLTLRALSSTRFIVSTKRICALSVAVDKAKHAEKIIAKIGLARKKTAG